MGSLQALIFLMPQLGLLTCYIKVKQNKNMWQKVRSTLAYIYGNYLKDYDYLHVCGDDTYVVVENLHSSLVG